MTLDEFVNRALARTEAERWSPVTGRGTHMTDEDLEFAKANDRRWLTAAGRIEKLQDHLFFEDMHFVNITESIDEGFVVHRGMGAGPYLEEVVDGYGYFPMRGVIVNWPKLIKQLEDLIKYNEEIASIFPEVEREQEGYQELLRFIEEQRVALAKAKADPDSDYEVRYRELEEISDPPYVSHVLYYTILKDGTIDFRTQDFDVSIYDPPPPREFKPNDKTGPFIMVNPEDLEKIVKEAKAVRDASAVAGRDAYPTSWQRVGNDDPEG